MWAFGWKSHRRRGLRTWVLSIISSSPKNGAEIMDDIEEMSQGWWRPSPGSVYPLLDEMTQEGLVSKNGEGRYEITEKGKQELDWPFGASFRRAPSVESMVNEMSGYVSYLEDLGRSDRSKLAPYLDKLKGISERLDQIVK
jgi:DNA-binding PadR family transcriptional regulator